METSLSLQQVSLPEKFTPFVLDPPVKNETTDTLQIFNKTALEKNPKALAQLICYLCQGENAEKAGVPDEDIPTLFDWAKTLHDEQKMPLHHFVKATCWYSSGSWFPGHEGEFENTFYNNLKTLLVQYDRLSEKSLQRIQKIAKIIQKISHSIPPNFLSNIVTSSRESLPDILLFAESEFHRDNGWHAGTWEQAFSKEAIHVAFEFCRTGKLRYECNESLLWEVMLLAENFEMDNLQKMCRAEFFYCFTGREHLLKNTRTQDTAKFIQVLNQLFTGSFKPRSYFPFGFHASIKNNAEYFINLHQFTDFAGISEAGQIILLNLRAWLTPRLEEGYKDGSLSLSLFFRCLLCLPSWAKENKTRFQIVIEKYTQEIVQRIQDGAIHEELKRSAHLIRKHFSEVEEFLPKVSIYANSDDHICKIPLLLFLADSGWVRQRNVEVIKAKDTYQIPSSPEALTILFQMVEGKTVSLSSFDLLWRVYETAEKGMMPRITDLCKEHILASEEFCSDVLAKTQQISDSSFLRECALKTASHLEGVTIEFLDSLRTWGVVLTEWEAAQKKCIKPLGNQNIIVSISCLNGWSKQELEELATICPKISVLSLRPSGGYWQEEEIINFFNTHYKTLADFFKNLKFVFLLSHSHPANGSYSCTNKEYSHYLSNPLTQIPAFDVFLPDGTKEEANIADYPAAAKEFIDIQSTTMREVDSEGFVHYTIDNPSDDKLIQVWDIFNKNDDLERLHSLEITDKNDAEELTNENGNLLRFIEKCTNLKKLTVDSSLFDDKIVSILPRACPDLVNISMNLSSYKGTMSSITNMLTSFRSLTYLSLKRGRQIDHQIITTIIEKCPNICNLFLSSTAITDSSLEKIATSYPRLTSLSVIDSANITDEGVKKIVENNKDLRHFFIGLCPRISHQTVLSILESTELSYDDLLWKFGKEKKGWYVFAPLKDLPEKEVIHELSIDSSFPHQIRVKGCEQITDKFITFICEKKPKIQGLDLRGCHQVTHAGIQQLVTECDSVESLFFANNVTISDKTIQCILEHCRKLQCLVLEDCEGITDISLKLIKNYRPALKHLSLAGCTNISSGGILSLATTCKKCQTIDLSNCAQLSGREINALVTASKKYIRKVRLSGCTLLRDRDLQSILNVCTQLKTLSIDGCSGISQEMRNTLFTKYPQLQKPSSTIDQPSPSTAQQDPSPITENDNSIRQPVNIRTGKMEEEVGLYSTQEMDSIDLVLSAMP